MPCTATATIDLIEPNTVFEDRVTQVDLRVTKIMRVGKFRLQGMFDCYNVFNVSPVLAEVTSYGPTWLRPTTTLGGRLFKFGGQVDF